MTAIIALLALMAPGAAESGDELPDCDKLPQAVKDQEDRYWKIYMGQLKGDELAEGTKLDHLTDKLRHCPPKPKTSPLKATAASAPAAKPPEVQGLSPPAPSGQVASPQAVSAQGAAPQAVSAQGASQLASTLGTAKPLDIQAVQKPPEIQAASTPLDLQTSSRALDGLTIAKPIEGQSTVAAIGGSAPLLHQEPSPNQEAFCTIVREFAQQYRTLNERDGNERLLEELRSARGEALRQAMGTTQILSWTATLVKPHTTGDGDAVVQVRLPCGATLKTWNNAMTDSGSGTLIAHDSPLFGSLAKLHEDQLVVIDGHLFQGARDGFTELSLTEPGSMLHPEFLFRFSNIRSP